MTRRNHIGILLSAALALNTAMSVGLGMDMGPAAVDQAHACCPVSKSQAPAPQNGPDCCMFAPGMTAAGWLWRAQDLSFGLIAAAPAVAPTPSASPEIYALPPPGGTATFAAPSSPRAPPRA